MRELTQFDALVIASCAWGEVMSAASWIAITFAVLLAIGLFRRRGKP
jgi:hypothetical protein